MNRFWKSLDSIEEYLAAYLLLITSALVFIEVVSRFIFKHSLYWSHELAIFLIIWFIFIGSSFAIRKNAHVSVDALTVVLPPLFKRILAILGILLAIVFSIMMIRAGWDMVMLAKTKNVTTPAMEIPMYIPYLAVPIGFILMLIRFSQELIIQIKEFINLGFSNKSEEDS